jgi:hypothetical protein
MEVVSFTRLPLYSRGTAYGMHWKEGWLGGPKSRPGRCREEISLESNWIQNPISGSISP